jgi:hypothetical protein
MSDDGKKFFINNLNSFVGEALFNEIKGEAPEGDEEAAEPNFVIYGTYLDKDSSEKPQLVKKMLKVL